MVTFHRVSYRNFLAAGNAMITVPLDAHQTTLVVGKNGAGKSTFTEAIAFALFGRALRDIPKSKLVNSINQRDCYVEVYLSVGRMPYLIKRGLKPSIFEIYANGQLIPLPAAIQDYQTMLETHILGMTFKTFQQVVILGNASYVPFMRLTAGARRELIETLLGIEVFSSMSALTKDDAVRVKNAYEQAVHTQRLLQEQHKMAETFTTQLSAQRDQMRHQLLQSLTVETEQLRSAQERCAEVLTRITQRLPVREQLTTATQKKQEYERVREKIERKLRKLSQEVEFYRDHEHCPTCEQAIDESFRTDKTQELTTQQTQALAAATQCQQLIDKYQDRVAQAVTGEKELSALERERTVLLTKIEVAERTVRDIQTRITQLDVEPSTTPTYDIEQLEQQLEETATQLARLMEEKHLIDAATMLLKDNGIKTRIIGHYLPIINKFINHYLVALDFPIQFTLDAEFTETIRSRYRDDFAYDSFSMGEKRRIDIALLLAWRAVAALKNRVSTNLLIMDEVFDSSLDTAGVEDLTKIFTTMERENIFIISHRGDQLADKFSHTLTFTKEKGFSTFGV